MTLEEGIDVSVLLALAALSIAAIVPTIVLVKVHVYYMRAIRDMAKVNDFLARRRVPEERSRKEVDLRTDRRGPLTAERAEADLKKMGAERPGVRITRSSDKC
jgi:hypothetical protein